MKNINNLKFLNYRIHSPQFVGLYEVKRSSLWLNGENIKGYSNSDENHLVSSSQPLRTFYSIVSVGKCPSKGIIIVSIRLLTFSL